MKTIYHYTFTFLLFFSTGLNAQEATGLITEHAPLPCLNKTFTIVAHIVRDTFGVENVTEEEILEAVAGASTDFEPICVDFKVCEFKYINNFQYDFLDNSENDWAEMQTKYNEEFRINMFFILDMADPYCGFATLGGITLMESGGVVIKKADCLTSRVISHELGHYFGLAHTFEGSGVELVNGSNCDTEGDQICDTPADPYVDQEAIALYVDVDNGCRFISPKQDANGEFYSPDVGNIMSYYDECICPKGFTHGQYSKMASTYLSSPFMW